MVKNPPAMWETCVRFLGGGDLLEEGMATHSRILAWGIPMDRGAWWATVMGLQRVDHASAQHGTGQQQRSFGFALVNVMC